MTREGDAAERVPPTYVSGERVFGPPLGTFDVDWVAREIERMVGTSFGVAHSAVELAWKAARTVTSVDEAAMATALADAGLPDDVVRAVTAQVVAYCRAYDVDPAAR